MTPANKRVGILPNRDGEKVAADIAVTAKGDIVALRCRAAALS